MTSDLPIDSQTRTWAMLAHLSIFANLVTPFGGLVAAILIYALRKDEPVARENERNALNFEILLAIVGFIGFAVYFVVFFGIMAWAALHGQRPFHLTAFPWPLLVGIGSIVGVFIISIAGAVTACFAARAAWLGRVFRYPIAIDFVR